MNKVHCSKKSPVNPADWISDFSTTRFKKNFRTNLSSFSVLLSVPSNVSIFKTSEAWLFSINSEYRLTIDIQVDYYIVYIAASPKLIIKNN